MKSLKLDDVNKVKSIEEFKNKYLNSLNGDRRYVEYFWMKILGYMLLLVAVVFIFTVIL